MPGQCGHAAVDGHALGFTGKQLGVLERVFLQQPFNAVHDPRHVAHAGNDLGLRKHLLHQRHLGAPHAVGVKDDFLRTVTMVGIEQAAQDAAALVRIHEQTDLAAAAHQLEIGRNQRAHRAAHAGVKAWVLPQQGRQQRAARTRQARDEVVTGRRRRIHRDTVGQKFKAKVRAIAARQRAGPSGWYQCAVQVFLALRRVHALRSSVPPD